MKLSMIKLSVTFAIGLSGSIYASAPAPAGVDSLGSYKAERLAEITKAFGYTGGQSSPRVVLEELAEGSWARKKSLDTASSGFACGDCLEQYNTDMDFGIQEAAKLHGVTMDQWFGESPTRKQVLAAVEANRLCKVVTDLATGSGVDRSK